MAKSFQVHILAADRPFYVGVQFHPEFKSRPDKPHPLFLGLVEAAKKKGGRQL